MEAPPVDQATAATALPLHPIDNLSSAKGKRTKRRLRLHSPIPFTAFASPPSASTEYLRLSLSPPLDDDGDSTTTKEVETAKCLLLLSRGGFSPRTADGGSDVRSHSQAPPLPRKSVAGSGGIYTCKTCSRTFSSFQALGGHRTSHRKMKVERKSTSAAFSDDEDFLAPPSLTKFSPNSLSLHLGTAGTPPKPSLPLSQRMHECSYCGAEFTSGQALGGHMRKHRSGPIGRSLHIPIDSSFEEMEIEESSKRCKSGLPLDLNLPAPEGEIQKFGVRKSPLRKDEAETGLGLSTGTPPPLTPLLIEKV